VREPVPSGLPLDEVRALLRASFDDFGDDDWAHCLGGLQVLLWDPAGLVGHAALVPRTLWCADLALRAGYVEGVAVRADARRRGHGAALMSAVEVPSYDLLALSSTDVGLPFYLARGWRPWRGPTAVRTAGGVVRTPQDDGSVLVLGGELDLDAELVCDWRSGDVW
jgi:aminoglycoside 2'-N-acetyltransferase I